PRRPRYLPFLGTGAAVGLLATVLVVAARGGGVDDTRKLVLSLAILFVGLGMLLGGALAVWLDRDHAGA
ncbi:MAG: hypothetical protein H0T17_00120, partial [Propionibacteriales bacterium]|nr:hypothetical protein [Propionibacteriales bacterium]